MRSSRLAVMPAGLKGSKSSALPYSKQPALAAAAV